jgi:hypothetical protein
MKNTTTLATLGILLLFSVSTSANLINNGDFSSCDFSGWTKDTDGFGEVSAGNDFEVLDNGKVCSAVINVDYFETAGDDFSTPLSEAFFANTLFQELNFTGSAGSSFELTIDVSSSSESDSNNSSFLADYFLIGLNDGTGNYFDENGDSGFLVDPTDINGLFTNTYTFTIDSSFLNQTGWFLDFQLNLGFDGFTGLTDGFGSSLFVNEVSLVAIPDEANEVNAPATIYLLSLFIAVFLRKKTHNV